MKAIIIEQYGGKEQLKEADIPKPTPGEQQVIVKLHATSINPIDWKLREGYLKTMMPFDFPIILGWDAAGVVSEVGEQVTSFKVGDRVLKQRTGEPMRNILRWMLICSPKSLRI